MGQSWEEWKNIEPDELVHLRTVEVSPAVGEVVIKNEAYWEDGVEPSWFYFSD